MITKWGKKFILGQKDEVQLKRIVYDIRYIDVSICKTENRAHTGKNIDKYGNKP